MAKVVDRDKGWNRIKSRAARDSGARPIVKVGLRDAGPGGDAHGEGGLTVAELGSIHEFGLGDQPERSFIRATFDTKQKDYERLTQRLAALYVDGKVTQRKALELLGDKARADIINTMNAGIEPPSLVDGRVIRLIESGQLKGSIDFEIEGA